MALNIFGGRKPPRSLEPPQDWPQVPSLPEAPRATLEQRLALAIPPETSPAATPASASPEQELLERIAGFRGAVADALYELSKDYRMLCDITHADIAACDEVVEELRRRLTGDLHYAVLAKLDEAHALVEARIKGETS
jgi:hypothetical protein